MSRNLSDPVDPQRGREHHDPVNTRLEPIHEPNRTVAKKEGANTLTKF